MNEEKNKLVTKRLKALIREHSEYEGEIEFDKDDFSLDQIDFDSIKFVELIVVIEEEFNVEFRDEDLVLEKVVFFRELDKLLNHYVNK